MTELLSTYRLQLHKDFPLARARALVSYLRALGVTHLYASPILQARTGSTHGYDVADPTCLNPELGTEEELRGLVDDLHAAGMGLVLDIVPNHMVATAENARWQDVLRHGRASRWAPWFDIEWRAAEADIRERVVLPVLGDQRVAVLERGEITLAFEEGEVRVRYFENAFPTDPATLGAILGRAMREVVARLGPGHEAVHALSRLGPSLRGLPPRSAQGADLARRRECAVAVAETLARLAREEAVREAFERALREFAAGEEGARRLRRFLDAQPYRLVFWRRGQREMNYRRFFDVNELVALHMENPEVFAEHHALVLEWVRAGRVNVLRIDHPDGLLDPAAYLRRLAAALPGEPMASAPIYVEKILTYGERLRDDWPVLGTTGYDFVNEAEALFIDPAGYERLRADYRRHTRMRVEFEVLARGAKRRVLESGLVAGVRRLADRLQRLVPDFGPRLTRHQVATAIAETIIGLPVYRTYADARTPEPQGEDRRILAAALREARERGRAKPAALDLLQAALLAEPGPLREPGRESARVRFVERFQQLSGPAMAKGVEDTAFYAYAPLLSRCEVGGEPEVPLDRALEVFHDANAHRAERWPRAMLAATTHDTKRTADVRSRLDVLSELPQEWERRIYDWRRRNRPLVATVDGRPAPDAFGEWFYYQTLVGIWPAEHAGPGMPPPDAVCLASLRERLQAYMRKAMKEAKLRTSWVDPDEAFEGAMDEFIAATLDPARSPEFLVEVAGFVGRIARAGCHVALARLLLQLASPGVPDTYQGDEIWNLALVDPDNRRPVDYARRRAMLETLHGGEARPAELLAHVEDGRLKLHLVQAGLRARRELPNLFCGGRYLPLEAEGGRGPHVVAFAREGGGRRAVVVVPRLVASRLPADAAPVGGFWGEDALRLPPGWSGRWRCRLAGHAVETRPDGAIALADAFAHLPVALLIDEPSPNA